MVAGQKRRRPESNSGDAEGGARSGSGLAADMSIFRPPILRSAALTASASLNKALFTNTFDISAARVHDNRLISKYQKALTSSREILRLDRQSAVVDDPEPLVAWPAGTAPAEAAAAAAAQAKPRLRRKCLLLQPQVLPSAPETWSDVIKQGVERNELGVFAYKLTLDYDFWTARDVLVSVLPEEFHEDIPTGFNTAGHVAHLNLRDRFLPYKHVVAEVLLDKNPNLRTVINKTDLVGTESAFRTFPYEVLAGPDDMDVEVRENACTYRFDYSKVYWNSKLEREHTRLLHLFRPGEVVVDLMAGIGPFAVPAGKRGVFVWANDMNPNSYEALCDAIQRNKVASHVRPFNEDGLDFIPRSADLVRAAAAAGETAPEVVDMLAPAKGTSNQGGAPKKPVQPPTTAEGKTKATDEGVAAAAGIKKGRRQPPPPRRRIPIPPAASHFVMNLPASAITFLPRFKGLYAGHEDLFRAPADPNAGQNQDKETTNPPKLPLVHTHCFAPKDEEDPSIPKGDVCARVSAELGVPMALCEQYADVEADDPLASTPKHLVYVHHVRAVAPHKSMFCASFRLPASVAFAPRTGT